MTRKTETMDLKGNDYAKVVERVKEFRKDNPNGLIETTPTIDGNMIVFKARVVKDKAQESSAEATGHAYGENKGAKAFEKLETIATGRALAFLGYAADGEIHPRTKWKSSTSTRIKSVRKQYRLGQRKWTIPNLSLN